MRLFSGAAVDAAVSLGNKAVVMAVTSTRSERSGPMAELAAALVVVVVAAFEMAVALVAASAAPVARAAVADRAATGLAVMLTTLAGKPEAVNTPSNSGKGQVIWRCASCRVAVWSNYGGLGDLMRFVRVGSLDEPDRCPPEIHIFTSSKQPWVVLPPGPPVFAEYYSSAEVWPKEMLERRAAVMAKMKPR